MLGYCFQDGVGRINRANLYDISCFTTNNKVWGHLIRLSFSQETLRKLNKEENDEVKHNVQNLLNSAYGSGLNVSD